MPIDNGAQGHTGEVPRDAEILPGDARGDIGRDMRAPLRGGGGDVVGSRGFGQPLRSEAPVRRQCIVVVDADQGRFGQGYGPGKGGPIQRPGGCHRQHSRCRDAKVRREDRTQREDENPRAADAKLGFLHKAKKAKRGDNDADRSAATTAERPPMSDMAMALLDDPEIKALVAGNQKFMAAVEDCIANPMNFMRYISDPEMSPLISKAMAKLKF